MTVAPKPIPVPAYDHWLGNYKVLLIFTVVFGHLIETFRNLDGNDSVQIAYNVIYLLHMPAFIFMSGYFFKQVRPKRIISFVVLYFIWQSIHEVYLAYANDKTLEGLIDGLLHPLVPSWTLWYLLGIIIWQIVTPGFLILRFPLLISVAVALLINADPGAITNFLSLQKVISFYPFFLMGYLVKERGWLANDGFRDRLTGPAGRLVGLVVSLTIAIFMGLWTKNGFDTAWLFYRDTYGEFEVSLLKGAATQLFLYAVSTVMIFSVLLIVPRRSFGERFDEIGIQTLAIYLLHSFIVRLFRDSLPPAIAESPFLLIGLGLLLATVLVFVLSSRPVVRILRPLLSPNVNWLFKKTS
ncbi:MULTISPECIES: acyltransferase family protein [unclassified Exiguobacterium]|uniref:acyltransferase family protein n=1 Tax=unclassified Exiguobacterium TaxID=2644629 RepID=UPI001BEB6A82|nr:MULTISPECIES: acyltransferase family protein [unclassified Exiguobacterium]